MKKAFFGLRIFVVLGFLMPAFVNPFRVSAYCEPYTESWCSNTDACPVGEICTDSCCKNPPSGGGDADGGWTCFPVGADGKLHSHLR
jgi:hypothetical protein